MNVSVEQLMYNHFIKYSRMTEMTNEAFKGSNASTVNVFIDMYSMIRPLYRFNNISIGDYSILTSSIINLCAHIRDFFRTRYRVETKIFIVNSNNCPRSAKQFYSGYNKKTELAFQNNAFISDFIKNNVELLKVLCPYLYDIFFIESEFETGVAIYDMLLKIDAYNYTAGAKKENVELEHCPSIVFSKDIYLYQLPSIVPDLVLYRTHKRDGNDASWYVDNSNVLSKYVENTRTEDRFGDITKNFNPEILSLLISLTNLPERGVRSILNISTAVNLINNAIADRKIINGYNTDIGYVASMICTGKIANQFLLFINRFKALDIKFQHSILYHSVEASTNMDSVVNLYDPETVKLLNNKYFRTNPLDLNRL